MPKTNTNSVQATVLPKEVAEQFEIAEGVLAQFVCGEFGQIDLTKINLELASRLAEKGYLLKKKLV